MRFIGQWLAGGLLLIMGQCAAAAMTNVIVNGTFDDTATGWTGIWGLRSSDPTLTTGTYLFAPDSASNTITQIYNLVASDVDALAGPGLNFTMSGDLFGWMSQGDHAVFTAELFGGAGGTGNSLV